VVQLGLEAVVSLPREPGDGGSVVRHRHGVLLGCRG
jgi:hypothetical protein